MKNTKTTEELIYVLAKAIAEETGSEILADLQGLQGAIVHYHQIDPDICKNIEQELISKKMEILRASELMAANAGELELAFKLRGAWQEMLPLASEEDREFFQAPKWEGRKFTWHEESWHLENTETQGDWRIWSRGRPTQECWGTVVRSTDSIWEAMADAEATLLNVIEDREMIEGLRRQEADDVWVNEGRILEGSLSI